MENNIDKDFSDINKESFTKYYIIVSILYAVVILLSILLVLGLKRQKEVISDNYNDKIEQDINSNIKGETNDINDEDNTKIEEDINNNKVNIQENKEDKNNNDLINNGLNILDQLR